MVKESSRQLYEFVAHGPFGAQFPPDITGLKGAVDIHVHVGYRAHDPLALAKYATQAGMQALVFKMPESPSVEVARLTGQYVETWAEEQGLAPVSCFGGVVLNSFLGGVNLELVKRTVRSGGRAVWLATQTSVNHLVKMGGLAWEEAKRSGVHILAGSRLAGPVRDLVKFAADEDIFLSCGHASKEEIEALAEEAGAIGFSKLVVDHPLSAVIGLNEDEVCKLARAGVQMNFTYFEVSPVERVEPRQMAEIIKRVGPDAFTLSSDVSLPIFPDPVQSLRMMSWLMRFFGLPDPWIEKMTRDNPRRLLGITT